MFSWISTCYRRNATDIDRTCAVVHGELLDMDSDDTSCTVKVCWGTEFEDILDDWEEVQTGLKSNDWEFSGHLYWQVLDQASFIIIVHAKNSSKSWRIGKHWINYCVLYLPGQLSLSTPGKAWVESNCYLEFGDEQIQWATMMALLITSLGKMGLLVRLPALAAPETNMVHLKFIYQIVGSGTCNTYSVAFGSRQII